MPIMKVVVSWSSGKDSVMTLHHVLQAGYEVAGLLCTVTDTYRRVSMHGVREELLEKQSSSLGLPLIKAFIPPNCSNQTYESVMQQVCLDLKNNGVESVAFGDIFLEDVRRYREKNLRVVGMNGLFPLWGRRTADLARTFFQLGYKAIVVVVDLEKLPKTYVGREYDLSFLEDLPDGCDPCGENGEFHTFVYSGPLFSKPVEFTVGGKVVRDGRFCFQDLVPTN
ncbi:MAG: diphthine--ammonia ligase [Candidatus Caldarchaeum sp.]